MNNFDRIKIRVGAIIQVQNKIILIQRNKNDEASYTLPGGNLENGEGIEEGLIREIREELNINLLPHCRSLKLLAIQDQMISRPGSTPPSRKLHLIFRISLQSIDKSTLFSKETDDLGEGNIVWIDINHTLNLHLYPSMNSVLRIISSLEPQVDVATQFLPAMTDENFRWI